MSGSELLVDVPITPATRLQVDMGTRGMWLDHTYAGQASEDLIAHLDRIEADRAEALRQAAARRAAAAEGRVPRAAAARIRKRT